MATAASNVRTPAGVPGISPAISGLFNPQVPQASPYGSNSYSYGGATGAVTSPVYIPGSSIRPGGGGEVLAAKDQNKAGGGGYATPQAGQDVNAPQFADWRAAQAAAPPGISDDQINNAYGEASNVYNQLYNDAVANKQNLINSYTQGYDALRPGIQNAYDQGVNLVNQQRQDVSQREASALDSARQLYQELSQGARQRFGGSTSAAEFSNDILGKQFQQNFGQIQNTAGSDIRGLNQKAQELQGQYQTQLQTLDLQKAKAQTDALNAFQQQLDSINQQKGALAQNKAQAKLAALQDYRNSVLQIQAQATQFQQQLALQHQASQDQLRNTLASYSAMANTGYGVSNQAAPQYSTFGGGSAQGSISTTPTGYVGNRDKNGNLIN